MNTETTVNARPVQILTNIDDDIGRRTYDADVYDEDNDGVLTHLKDEQNQPQELNNISLQDITSFIDTITEKSESTVKQFTTKDLQRHINNHWRLKIKVQMDSGASDCITADKTLLKQYRNVKSRKINTADINSQDCKIEGEGYMDIRTSSGEWLTIKTLYVPNASGTIISPTFIALDNPNFTSWYQMNHTDTGQAKIIFFHRQEYRPEVSIHMYLDNNCWYLDQSYLDTIRRAKGNTNIPISNIQTRDTLINSMNKAAEYEIWHQRLIHPGQKCMDTIHHCVDGIPKLKRHDFHTCPICQETKIAHQYNKNPEESNSRQVGEIFSMDYGFVKGRIANKLVRSHDGYSSYLLIVDHKSRYMWVFLTKNKAPPLHMVGKFLRTYGLQNDTVKIVRTDQGGELARSAQFCDIVEKCGYQVEITGADNSSQNGKVERPHQTLANMMRSSLDNASLHSKYWSDALLHCVYVKNRLPHSAFKFHSTPYTQLTGVKPNLAHLIVFGSRITVRKPGKRIGKISTHHYNGIFLRYAKIISNVVYIDTISKRIKTATHAVFDEAHYSQKNRSRGAEILMKHGYVDEDFDSDESKVKKIRPAVKVVRVNQTQEKDKCLIVIPDNDRAIIPSDNNGGGISYGYNGASVS